MAQGSSNPTTDLKKVAGTAVDVNTGNASAGTQRVVLASNQPVVPVSDNGGSLTVDGTVAATQSGTWTVQPGNTANTTPWLVKPAESLGTATALGALNAEIVQALNGNLGVGSTITAISTPTGITLTPYVSYDGGTNWTATQFFNVTSALALSTITSFVAGDSYAISAGDGATHVKVRATAWTSGSVTVRLSASNSQGLVNLKSTAVHDDVAGTYTQLVGAYASATAPTAVSANGDAVRLWATTSGALNVADGGSTLSIDDGGGSITVDGTVAVTGTFWQATQPVSLASLPALAAGTNAIGKLAANDAVDIGDVTINNAISAGVYVRLTDGTNVMPTGDAAARGVYHRLTDGTNTAAVKAASTAAAATDPALVVAISPNNTVPVSLASVPSHAVTNAGTFAVQATQVVGSAATRWYAQLSDGTNSPAIKAASTAAAATDPALVVAISPNNTVGLSAGTNAIGKLAANSGVDIGDVDVLSVTPGVGATNLGKAVNDVAGATDVGVAALVLRDDALAALSPADGDYTRLRVNSTGRLWATTDIEGAVANAANSSTTVLAAAGVFTGTSVDVSAYAQVRVNVYASHASATSGLSMQFSPDGTNWDHTSVFTVPATSDVSYVLPVTHKFFRVVYTNGATLQTAFRLTTALITNATTGTIKELSSSVDRSDFALSTRSVIAGPATPGTTIALNEVTVKNASTAAAATDTALVVTHHPSSSGVKVWDGTNTAAVKTAITDPAFGVDTALVVQPRDPVRIRPYETLRDPVDKMRVSTPQSLIDTDFEYGIQPTKWESLTLLNNRATAFYDATQAISNTASNATFNASASGSYQITNLTANLTTKVVTVAINNTQGITVGTPIFIQGTLDTANVDGWWIVDTVTSNTSFTFLVNNVPVSTSLYDQYRTYVYIGSFFTGSNIPLFTAAAVAGTVSVDATGTFTTTSATTFTVGQPIVITGTLGGTGTITGYASGNLYYVIATNGTTTFQLSATPGGAAITTTAGTPTGLTYTRAAIAVSGTTVVVKTLNDHGLRVGNAVYITGTTGVTGGPVNGSWIVASTPTNDTFTYTTNATATGSITAAAGVNATLYPRQPGYIEHRPYDGGVQFSNETAYPGYTDIRQTRRYFRYQSGKGIQFSTGTILKPPFYVDSLTASGTTVTITTKYPHGLLTGSTVIVSGCTPAQYNGTFTVTGSTPLTITYTAGSAPTASPATGFPITVSPGTWYGGSNRIGMFDQQNGFFYEFDGQTLYAVLRKSVDQIAGRAAVTAGSKTVTGTNTFFSSQLKPGDQVIIRGMAYIVQQIQSDTSMNIYPEYRGVTTSNCIVTKTVETRIPQSSWNIDTVSSGTRSATNPNGFTLDLTKMQMFYIDYSWYGAGAIRFGFKDQRGEVILCHRIVNSNVNYEAYMRSGNLPARYETNTLANRTYLTEAIRSTATSTAATLSTVTIADTAGNFTCAAADLVVGGTVTITGTLGGTGTITGYTTGTKYYIVATNGSTTFQLSTTLGGTPVVTTAGTPTGLTYTLPNTINVADASLFPTTGTVMITQNGDVGCYTEYMTYTAKSGNALTIGTRASTGGVGSAKPFSLTPTKPIKVELYLPQAAQTLSHWGSSVIMDGGYDDDKSLVFNTGLTTTISTATAGSRYPILSLRLAPTVDNGLTGLLGVREVINRMQLTLRSMGAYTKNVPYRIEVLLNARVSGGTSFVPVGGSSLAQVCNHGGSGFVSGGESMFAFYSNTNDTISQDLSQVRDIGTSILGGGTSLNYPSGNNDKYPDGPDIVTIIAIPLESTPSFSSVTIADTAGNFTCNATTGLAKGQKVTITGTLGGTGSITGYASGNQYYIINTNGRTTFQLSATEGGAAITTTAGTPTGLTYTNSGVGQIAARLNWTEAQA